MRPIGAGETLAVDNHRMLHGRTGFEGERDFVRVLAWFARPLAVHARYEARTPPPRAGSRLDVVLEMLTGVPPARLAAREGVTEAELYAWRTRALAAASSALED